ncbi:glycosyltransferase family 4 protein [Winogradskyella sp.]|uniref:glycosyltransferase family 4 protein n=1 Tax=Winogradskyella sp. TaxID=1883156 RepID=UPI0035C83239
MFILSKEWARHGKSSGYQRISEYFSIPFSYAKSFKIFFFISEYLKKKTRIKNYQSNTLSKECVLLFKIFTAKTIYVQYGDMDFYYLHYLKKFPFNLRKNTLIVTFHHPPYELEDRLNYDREKVLGAIDKIIVMGRNQIPFFKKYSNAEIKFIPHGINLEYFHLDKNIPRKNQIVLVGTSHRDHNRNIQIIKNLNGKRSVQFKIVMFKDHAINYEGLKNVELITSNISDKKLLKLYQSSKAMLMSLKDCTASNAILESMASGCPVVINNVGAVRDYFFDDNIKVFNTNDINGTIEYIERLLDDESFLFEEMHKQIKLVKFYDWKSIALKTEKFILNER